MRRKILDILQLPCPPEAIEQNPPAARGPIGEADSPKGGIDANRQRPLPRKARLQLRRATQRIRPDRKLTRSFPSGDPRHQDPEIFRLIAYRSSAIVSRRQQRTRIPKSARWQSTAMLNRKEPFVRPNAACRARSGRRTRQ